MKAKQWGSHIFLIVSVVLMLYPLFWMVSTSFKAPPDIFGDSLALIPPRPTVMNYVSAWSKEPILRYLWNSLYTSGLIAFAQVLTSLLAAYALSRFEFPGRELLFLVCIGTMMVPFHLTMIPNYLLVSDLGWINKPWALIVPQMANALGIFMLRQHMLSFPRTILEAAQIDGANPWQTLWRVLAPSLKPAISAVGILFFLNAWNQYFWPMLVFNDPHMYTFPLGLQRFVHSEAGNNWGELMAAASMASAPVIAIYIVLQRQIVQSAVMAGVKG